MPKQSAKLITLLSALALAAFVQSSPAMARPAQDGRDARMEEGAAAAAAAAAAAHSDADAVEAASAAAAAAGGYTTDETGDIAQPYGRAWGGNPDGNVTLVIFADYGCPACREAQAVTDRLIAEDPYLRVVYRFIVLDAYPGKAAAQSSLAVAMSETDVDWHKFHRALMNRGATSPKAIAAIAREQNIPDSIVNRIAPSIAMESDAEISRNDAALAYGGGSSLPAWAVGTGKVTMGHSYSAIKAAIAKDRSDKAM